MIGTFKCRVKGCHRLFDRLSEQVTHEFEDVHCYDCGHSGNNSAPDNMELCNACKDTAPNSPFVGSDEVSK